MMIPRPCKYCGVEYANTTMHERSCCKHPERLRALRAFMLDHSKNGAAMSAKEYEEITPGTGMPSRHVIVQTFGSYGEMCGFFGLVPQRTRRLGHGRWDHALPEYRRVDLYASWPLTGCSQRTEHTPVSVDDDGETVTVVVRRSTYTMLR